MAMRQQRTKSRQRKSIEQLVSSDILDKVTFRDADVLKLFISTQGKILPRRKTGISSRHQRRVSREIKRARDLGLIRQRGQEN